MKIAIIDIDGVLNYYPQTIIDYCNYALGTNYDTLKDIKENISFSKYTKLKAEYRISAFKHDAKARKGAKELLQYLRDNDYLIYIVTSRQLFVENMLENTILWLKKNKLVYDYIYSSIKKDFTIFEKFSKIDLVVEDNVNNIENIKAICNLRGYNNIKYYNVVNKDNCNKDCSANRITDLNEIILDIESSKGEQI